MQRLHDSLLRDVDLDEVAGELAAGEQVAAVGGEVDVVDAAAGYGQGVVQAHGMGLAEVEAGEPFHTLEEEAGWWIGYLPEQWERSGRAVERRLVDAAVDALTSLSQSQGEQVLLHQDLHGDNVLAAERKPWLVIDPKPLLGEREFAVAPIVRSFELGQSKRDALYRLDRVTSELGLDRDRARAWTIGQTMAWAFDSSYISTHLDTVRWLLEDAE